MRFRVVGLSIPTVPTLCLKVPQMGNDIIYPKLLTVGLIHWNKSPGCRQLKDKKNSPLKINNYIVKQNGATIIYTIYIYRERERGREKLSPLLCLRGRQLRYLAGAVFFLSYSIFRRVRLERLLFLERFLFLFSCLWYGHRISSLIKP